MMDKTDTFPKMESILKIKEKDIIKAICGYLQLLENQKKLMFYRNNTGAVKIDKRFFRFGKKGSPDIIILLPNGITLWVEVKKSAIGKLSPAQENFRDWCVRLGHIYLVTFGIDDFIVNLHKFLESEGK